MNDWIGRIGGVVFTGGLLILLCTAAEWISRREPFRWRARWPGVLFGLAMPMVALLMSYPLWAIYGWLGFGPLVDLKLDERVGIAGAVISMLLAADFLAYWEHRFEHRFLWRVHAVHHSVEELSAATSFGHPLQFLPMFFLIGLPLSLIDFGPPEVPLLVAAATTILQLFIHSPTRIGFGPLRHLFVDAPFHRIHHSLEERHFDRNFSILFSFWDRLFGTQTMPEKGQWPQTGIREAPSPQTVVEYLAMPFRLPEIAGAEAAADQPDAAKALHPAGSEARAEAA